LPDRGREPDRGHRRDLFRRHEPARAGRRRAHRYRGVRPLCRPVRKTR